MHVAVQRSDPLSLSSHYLSLSKIIPKVRTVQLQYQYVKKLIKEIILPSLFHSSHRISSHSIKNSQAQSLINYHHSSIASSAAREFQKVIYAEQETLLTV